eukprot:c9208_g1_i1.p1 GENE.c9208_g1_i1~~c9208_g1_i1.p1  ORF type:complete len:207 (-),score=40.36 c9208_g1_i1:101-661(-)
MVILCENLFKHMLLCVHQKGVEKCKEDVSAFVACQDAILRGPLKLDNKTLASLPNPKTPIFPPGSSPSPPAADPNSNTPPPDSAPPDGPDDNANSEESNREAYTVIELSLKPFKLRVDRRAHDSDIELDISADVDLDVLERAKSFGSIYRSPQTREMFRIASQAIASARHRIHDTIDFVSSIFRSS